jgi:hypothetical protein
LKWWVSLLETEVAVGAPKKEAVTEVEEADAEEETSEVAERRI